MSLSLTNSLKGLTCLHFGKSYYPEFIRERFQKKMKYLKKYSSNVNGLADLLDEINSLNDLSLLKRLMNAYDLKRRIYDKGVFRDDFFNSHLMILAKKNLQPSPWDPNLFKEIVFEKIPHIYHFFEYFYYMNTEKPLSFENMANIYYSGLGERVMLFLDKFDEPETPPELNDEFFQVLKKVKWQKQSKKLFNKIIYIFGELETRIHAFSIFESKETIFIKFLCFCSAASNNRKLISEEDVVKAFKTYIKLMKTDVTQYKTRNELIEPSGYLVCDKCNKYYKLQPGESTEDFVDKCECGGNLRFVKHLMN